MLYARVPLRALHLVAALAAVSATSLPSNWLLERDGTCAASFNKCTQAGLPANFCCPQGSTCNLLAGGTTVLCCPTNQDCSTIKIISCTLSLQDPAQNPKAEIKTTVLNGKLPTCGNGCCPFGYHCDGNNFDCVADADQSKKPGQASSSTHSPTSTATPSSTASSSSTQTGQAGTATSSSSSTTAVAAGTTSAASSSETPSSAAAQTLNIAAIVGGVVGGIAIILLITAGIWLLRRKSKKVTGGKKKHDSVSSFEKNAISAPIPHADYYAQRLDFLAKAQSSSVASSPTGAHERFTPSSPYSSYAFRRDSEMVDRPRSHHVSAEIGGLRNLTHQYSGGTRTVSNPFETREERQNSGGSESINIFADPSAVHSPSFYERRETTWTTWTDLQHRAEHEPEPELPGPVNTNKHGANLTVPKFL